MIKKIKEFYRRIFWTPEKYARYLGVQIGKNCSINTVNFGTEPYLIKIGNHVQITNDVKFFCHGAAWVFREKHPNFDTFGKIEVKNNVYIGNNSLIMPGVTIGNDVIIGAGSVVTKSVQDGLIVAGNPARVIGRVDDLEEKLIAFNLNTKGMNYTDKKNVLIKSNQNKFIKK
jgi:acetyltransferase-like isoleucine patch superfamily enzyme